MSHVFDQIASFLKSSAISILPFSVSQKGCIFWVFLHVSRFVSLVSPLNIYCPEFLVDGQYAAALQELQTGSRGAIFGHVFVGLCCFKSSLIRQTCGLATAPEVLDVLVHSCWILTFILSPGPFALCPWLGEFC